MNIKYGKYITEHGPGVIIELTCDEIATAIDAYLVSHGICVRGPRTITIEEYDCYDGQVYVDPSGFVIAGGKKFSGSGPEEKV